MLRWWWCDRQEETSGTGTLPLQKQTELILNKRLYFLYQEKSVKDNGKVETVVVDCEYMSHGLSHSFGCQLICDD